jgi:hypothetical protein
MKRAKFIAAAAALALGCPLASAGTSVDFHRTSSRQFAASVWEFQHHQTGHAAAASKIVVAMGGNDESTQAGIRDGSKNRGANGVRTAVPLPPALYIGLMMLLIIGTVSARKHLAAIFA